MTKKILAFDLDDTLAVTKSPMSDRMATALSGILDYYEVCIISGGRFEQFKNQVIDRLHIDEAKLTKVHLMPTCGTQYYRYQDSEWVQQYAEDLTEAEKAKAIGVLKKSAQELGLWESKPWGDIIEDRGSQITFSALGQQAPPEEKYKWAEKNQEAKHTLRDTVARQLPELEVRLGGSTSIDITRVGIDKAYGMKKLIEATGYKLDEILFYGDKLEEGGNDYPVKELGIDSLEVSRWEDTALILESIAHVRR